MGRGIATRSTEVIFYSHIISIFYTNVLLVHRLRTVKIYLVMILYYRERFTVLCCEAPSSLLRCSALN